LLPATVYTVHVLAADTAALLGLPAAQGADGRTIEPWFSDAVGRALPEVARPGDVSYSFETTSILIQKPAADAILGEKKKPHAIVQEKCIKCMECYKNCKFNAIAIR